MNKKYYLILIAVFSVILSGAQTVQFHSPRFEVGVRMHLDVDNTKDMTVQVLDTITSLDLSGLEITDIRDVEYLPNLQRLNLDFNEVDNLAPLLNLEYLNRLSLRYNNLESINMLAFATVPEMTIDVSFNHIEDFSCFNSLTPCCFTLEGVWLQTEENSSSDSPEYAEKMATVSIGASGKTSYCGSKSLDFSSNDEIKAYIATGYDEGAGIIWLTRVKDVPEGTPVLIKGLAEKTYGIPVTDSQNSYYENMFVGNTSGETIQVGETDGALVNYYLSGKDGTFKSVNKSVNIGNNKSYLQLPGSFAPAAQGDAQIVQMAATGKASYAAPVDLDFTNVEGLKAFTATGYDKSGTIWLTRVMKVQKGEGLLLKGEAEKDYTIPSVAVQSGYKNLFVGNVSDETIVVGEKSEDSFWTYYYLSGKDGTFKSVNKTVNIKPNKSYLKLPTSMLSTSSATTRGIEDCINVEEPEVIAIPIAIRRLDAATGIKANSPLDQRSLATNGTQEELNANSPYYNLQGQRVENPGKGLYIHNGKIIIIR